MINNYSRTRFETRPRYLFVEMDCGGLTYPAALGAFGDVMFEAAHQHCRTIMIKCRTGSIETDEMLLGSILVLAGLNSGTRIAFVECQSPTPDDHPALGREIKLFSDEESAEKWLLDVPNVRHSEPDADPAFPHLGYEDS